MRAHEAAIAAAGATLVFVGSGLPAMAADFQRTQGGGHPVFSDADRALFRAAGAVRGLGSILHWRLLVNSWRALRAGFRQGRIEGDPYQQGGVVVIEPDGEVRYRQIDRVGGDPLDVEALLASLRSTPSKSRP